MASGWYNRGKESIFNGGTDVLTDVIQIMLMKSTYTFDADHTFATAVADELTTGTGYTGGYAGSGRKTLASKTVTRDDTNDRAVFDAADPSAWTAINTGTVGGALVLKKGASDDTTAVPLVFLDPTDVVTNGGDATATFNASGICYL